MITVYEIPNLHAPKTIRTDYYVTSVRILHAPSHDFLTIYNRGANTGEIAVKKGDGKKIAELLIPNFVIRNESE